MFGMNRCVCFSFASVMYPAYAKWVQSHRDLPIKLNQWCNVVVSNNTLSVYSSYSTLLSSRSL